MSNPAHDQAALDAATEIMALVHGPKLLGGDAQLKAKIQCLIIDALGQYGRATAGSVELCANSPPVIPALRHLLDPDEPSRISASDPVAEVIENDGVRSFRFYETARLTLVAGDKLYAVRPITLATQSAEWVDPVSLSSVGPVYDQGFADGVAEAKRLNYVRGAENE